MAINKLDALMKLYEKECEQESIHTNLKKSIWDQIELILGEEEFIRPKEAARILGVSGQTVINWIRIGVFRPDEYKKVSNHTYLLSKRVVKTGDFFKRRKNLGSSTAE